MTQFPYINQSNIPNFPVTAGQTVSCSVQYVNNNTAGLLYMLNETTNQHYSVTFRHRLERPSTEPPWSGSWRPRMEASRHPHCPSSRR